MSSFKLGGGPAIGTVFDLSITSDGVTKNLTGNWRQPPPTALAAITAARTNLMVAPAAIHFEVNVDDFDTQEPVVDGDFDPTVHNIQYRWSFGDAGTQHLSSDLPAELRDANTAYGKIVGHLFETPGSYTVTCEAFEPVSGKSAVATTQITIADRSDVFAAQDINYVDPDGQFTAAPVGARQFTSLNAFLNELEAGDYSTPQIVYLRRGVSHPLSDVNWTGSAQIPSTVIMSDPATGGSNAVLTPSSSNAVTWLLQDCDPAATADLSFYQVDFQGDWDTTTETGNSKIGFSTSGSNPPDRTQFVRCKFSGFSTALAPSGAMNLAVANCEFTNWQSYAMNMSTMGGHTMLVGNTIKQSPTALAGGPKVSPGFNDHGPVRWFSCTRPVILGNHMVSRNGWFENIDAYQTIQPCVRFLTGGAGAGANRFCKGNVQGNIFEGGEIVFSASTTNGGSEAALTSTTFERNIVVGCWFTRYPLYVRHGGFCTRNNLFIRPDVLQPNTSFQTFSFVRFADPDESNYNPLSYPQRVEGNTIINLASDDKAPSGSANVAAISDAASGYAITQQANFIHQPNLGTPNTPYTLIDDTPRFTPEYDGYRSRYQRYLSTYEAEAGGAVPNGGSFSVPYAAINPALTQAAVNENPIPQLTHEIKNGGKVSQDKVNASFAFDANGVIVTNNSGGTLSGSFTLSVLTDDDALINFETEFGTPADSVWNGRPLAGSTNNGVVTALAGWDDLRGVRRSATHSAGAIETA